MSAFNDKTIKVVWKCFGRGKIKREERDTEFVTMSRKKKRSVVY